MSGLLSAPNHMMPPATEPNNAEGSGVIGGGGKAKFDTASNKGSPPPYDHALYSSYAANQNGAAGAGELQIASFSNPTPATTSASYVGGTTSFTNTFLRGILTSIDSKDPVVANAWLDTLLDAIDLLPPDVIKREIIVIAVGKGQISNNVASRKSACRLLGKIATKLDAQTLRQDVLPTTLALCQDIDWEVRHAMCRHLALIARGVGHEATKSMIMPQLVELSNDEVSEVRLAAIETVVNLLSVLDDDICTQTIVPLVIKSCDQAKQLEDETLPRLAHHLGRLCHGLMPNINADHKAWFINFYKHLSAIGVDGKMPPRTTDSGQMPDLVPPLQDKSELYAECRKESAYNFPAMVIFVGPSNFVESLYATFAGLASDPVAKVRRTLASSLHELAKLVGTTFNTTKVQIVRLFHDDSVDVLDAMITNMVHVIDALARFGVLQFGQGGQFSADLSAALLHCEATVDRTRNWRLQADCLEKFSCLANCISPVTIQTRFIPLLFDRMKNTRTLPCKIAAARTLLVILRFTVKSDDRTHIHFRVHEELARANSCHIRMLYLRLCEMAMALFSKEYFKQHFFGDLVGLSADIVANVRLKLCTMMPRLKALLSLPSDKALLQRLEATVKDLLLRETDADVLFALQTSIQDLDGTETGVDGVPSMNVEEDRDNERKLREERLIASMEEQLYKIHSVQSSPSKKLSHVPITSTSSASTSPRQRLLPSTNNLPNNERQLPPPLMRPLQPDLSSLAHQTPEPSRTYSPELSVLKNDKNNFFDFGPPSPAMVTTAGAPNPVHNQPSWDSLIEQNMAKENGNNMNHHHNHHQPYSSSLENLDPSAKEFLVDAGVILDNSSNALTSASSMPNLAVANHHASMVGTMSNDTSASMSNLEGEFSKYLISNAEMEQYEAEYQRCASIIANGSIEQLATQPPQQQTSPTTNAPNVLMSSATAMVNNLLTSAAVMTSYPATSTSNTTIPSTPPMGIPRQSRAGSPTKTPPIYQGSPPPPPPPTLQSVGVTVTNDVVDFATSTFTKLTSGSSDIQESIERLAEKWEAKRKSLIAVASGSFDFEDGGQEAVTETMEIAKQQRATIMEQKLQAIKQQGIPKKRSLLKTPSKTSLHGGNAQKRLSLTDQVEAVGQKAVHKFIIEPNQRRKSVEMMMNFSDSEERTSGESSSGDEVNNFEHLHHHHQASVVASASAADKMNAKFRGMHLNDRSQQQPQSLPPYPTSSRAYEANAAAVASSSDDSMITYVGASNNRGAYGYSASGSPTHLVVKPVNTNPMMANPPRGATTSGLMRLPSNPPRSLPQPPRSLPMPPTYRQTPPGSNSLIRAPSTSLLSNRSVYSVNKPKSQQAPQQMQHNTTMRQLPQPKQRPFYQPVAVLPQPPSPKKVNGTNPNAMNGKANGSKPISPYIVSVNSPPDSSGSPDHSPTSGGNNITNSSGSNVSTGSSSSQSSTEGNSGPKYTRVPPPRYRPHQPPLAQRRPLSGGHYQDQNHGGGGGHHHHHRMNNSQESDSMYHHHVQQQQHGSNLRQTRYGGKSVSAESVLVNGQARGGYNKASSGGSSSRSSSPQSSNSESQLTPPDDGSGNGSGDATGNQRNKVGIPQGPMRRSSGLRMWQGQIGQHQSRANSNGSGVPMAQQQPRKPSASAAASNSRSPSPGNNRAQSQPRSSMMKASRGPSSEQAAYHRGSSLPGAYQMSYSRNHPGSTLAPKQQQAQSGGSRRPNSLHNSPGTSRPSSPQISMHQKRKSSHYPGSNNLGNGGRSQPTPPSSSSSYNRNEMHHHQQQQHHHHHHPSSSGMHGGGHRGSLSSLQYSNNAKRQIQQPSSSSGGQQQQQQKQQQFASSNRAYSTENSSGKMGLPAPGFSSRLPMGTSQRSN